MPIFGDRDVISKDGPLHRIEPSTVAVETTNVEILQLLLELPHERYLSLVPSAFHPTNPPAMSITLVRCGDSPFGTFSYAHLGIVCRAGVRLRSYLLKTVVDSPKVAIELAKSWGYRTESGTVLIDRGYDEVTGIVELEDRVVLDVAERAPIPLASSDLFLMDFMNVGLIDSEPRFVQVDPEYVVRDAERGAPIIRKLDAKAWGESALKGVQPITAVYAHVDMALPQVRFICRTDVPAFEGTDRITVEAPV